MNSQRKADRCLMCEKNPQTKNSRLCPKCQTATAQQSRVWRQALKRNLSPADITLGSDRTV